MKKEFKGLVQKILSKSGINWPFPENLDFKGMPPIIVLSPYYVDYIHSFGQDSPFFLGVKNKKLLSTYCPYCGYKYGTPRAHCMYCGKECQWFELSRVGKLPRVGKVHAFTVCHFGSEAFLKETPFILALVEYEGVNTLFLSRLKGLDPKNPSLDWIGMPVEVKFKKKSRNSKNVSAADVYFIPVKK